MSLRKDVARVVRLKEFHSRVERLLTPADRDYFFYALKEYNTYKSVAKLMLALNSCLDTPEKLDLLPSIRDLIPRHDRKKFDNLAPYNRMAHRLVPAAPAASDPPADERATGTPLGKEGTGESGGKEAPPRESVVGAVKMVFLQRSKGESLGFSIRGGREHDLGIFISHVDSFSVAEKSGLLAGDKIVSVNGFSFDDITHQSAALILKSHDRLQISVVSVGHIPGHHRQRKSLIWVDTAGKPVDDEQTAELSNSMEEDRDVGDRLLASPDRHKVVLRVEKQQPLGFSVRGGKEFSLGIFISQVDPESPAEQFGLKAGDQILDVNGHSFHSILHQEAVTILKTYTTLIMTVRSLGRLPLLISEDKEEVDGPRLPQPPSPPIQPQQAHLKEHFEHTHNDTDHTHTDVLRQKRWRNWKKSVSRRSQSLREFLRPRSLYASRPHHSHRQLYHHLPSHSHHRHPPRHSYQDLATRSRPRTGSDGALTHHSKPRATTTHSTPPLTIPPHKSSTLHTLGGTSTTPLSAPQSDQTKPQQRTPSSTHTAKGAGLRVEPGDEARVRGERGSTRGEEGGGMFFRYGVGTQLMLATASSSAKALVEDSARRCLDSEEMAALTERLREYESNGGVETFAEFLVSLLDTPRKMQLLSDIRSVLAPSDLVTFDGIVSPHEIAALQKRASLSDRERHEEVVSAAAGGRSPVGGVHYKADLSNRGTETSGRGGLASSSSRGRNMSVTFDREAGNESGEREGGWDTERGTGVRSGGGERMGRSTRGGSTTACEAQASSLLGSESAPRSEGRERVRERRGREERVGEGEEREERVREREERKVRAWEEGEREERIAEEDEEGEDDEGEGEKEEEEGDEGSVYDEGAEQEEEGEGEGEGEAAVGPTDTPEGREDKREEELVPAATQDNYNLVLYEIQNHQGQESLRRAVVKEGGLGSPHIGAFGTEPANTLLNRATGEEPSMLGMQTRESFLEWNDDYTADSHCSHTPSRNPVIIEIAKTAPQLGLTIMGGVDTPSPGVTITDVREGGAAGNDGFLQPGYEIVQVDRVRIRGLTHDSAARELAAAFRSERPTIELIVIPV